MTHRRSVSQFPIAPSAENFVLPTHDELKLSSKAAEGFFTAYSRDSAGLLFH